MDWAQIIVILLAILFAIFLILAIALVVVILSITRQIKAATATAERTIHALEGSVANFNRVALPLTLAKGVFGQFMKKSPKKEKKPAHEQK